MTEAIFGGRMITLVGVIFIGFFLGMRHATDPDHVIAVTTIVTRQRSIRNAALIGALWGLGHTITIFAVGAAIILFSAVIPPRVGLSMELSVGLMLILLGILNLTGTLRRINRRFDSIAPGDLSLARPEASPISTAQRDQQLAEGAQNTTLRAESWLLRTLGGISFFYVIRPLIVGVVHGLAGSAAVALLVLTTIRDPWWALIYLVVFGIGTVAGMMLITSAIAVPIAYSGKRFAGFDRTLATASGLLSLAFGCFLSYHISFVDGLLTSHPHWTPH